ncbi:MAG: hypothetical protein ABSH20_18270, partial [Tepidisphaeraceae bacterium]
VVFSEPVTGFTGAGVTLGGTAGATTAVVTGSGDTYNVAVTNMTQSGTVIATIPAGAAVDAAGNTSLASTSTVNTITFASLGPSVTINQAAAQADPTNVASIDFTVVFSAPVTGFTNTGVLLGGTAGATTAVVTPVGVNGDTYIVTVTGMTQTGTVIATIAGAAATDGGGDGNTASTSTDNTVTYDITAPGVTVTLAPAQPDPTGATPINFRVTFNEPVTGFTNAGVTLDGTAPGTLIAVVTPVGVNGDTYNVAVSGMTGPGTVSVSIPADAAQDLAGNSNTASVDVANTVNFDNVVPNVTINKAVGQASPTNNSPINFTAVFDKPVTGFTGADVALAGTAGATTAAVTPVGVDGMTYNVAVSGMTGPGTVIATIPAGVALDLAGNGNTVSTSTDNTVNFDNVVPTVTIEQAAAQVDPAHLSPINFTVVFSKPVSGFTSGGVALSGSAGATTAVVTGAGTTYNVAVSGMTGPGTVIATVTAGAASDASGNANLASTSVDNTVTFDNVAPAVTVNQAVAQADPTAVASADFTVVFSKPVTGFTSAGVVIGGTAGATTAAVTGAGTTYDVQVTGMSQTGTVILTVPAGVATDDVGNTNNASTSTDNTVTYDITPPAVTINQAATQADPTNAANIRFTVVFSEPVTVFTGSDVLISGTAGATTAVVTGAGPTYNVAISGMTQSGTVIVAIPAGAAIDAAGNPSLAATSIDNTVTYDNVRPTVTINQAVTQRDPTNEAAIHFTVVFSEPVVGFTGAKVTLGGTAGATTATVVSGDGTTFDIAVSGMSHVGTVTARIPANAVTDPAGNNNRASTTTDNTVNFDNVPPSVTIDQAGGQIDPTNASPINFTVVFSKPVTGFDQSGVAIGGTLAGTKTVVVTGSGTTYNVAVSGMNGIGTVTATIPAGVATDLPGNVNNASTSTDNTVLFDNTPPAVTIGPALGQAQSTRALTINYAVVFSKPVTGFTSSDVVIGGTAGATTAVVTGSGTTYNVAVSGMAQDGTIVITVPAGVAVDAIGNLNAASTGANDIVTYDTTSPTVTIDQTTWQADPTNAPAIHYTVVFSEVVGGFAGDDLVLGGTAGATTAVVTGMGTTYDVAVSGMTRSGTVIATIPAGSATDAAGNPSLASSSTDNIVTYDTVAPTVTINQAAGQADPTEDSPINFTVVFSKPVTGFGPAGLVLNGSAGATTAVVTGSGTTYNVALSGMQRAGTVIPSIPAWVATDAAGNRNAPSTSTDNTVFYGDLPPTVAVQPANAQADPTNAATINFTVVFSKPVTAFDADSVIISGNTGASAARVTGSGTTYNVAVSGMYQTGTVAIGIAAGAALDAAGTGNAASAVSNPVNFDLRLPSATLHATTLTKASTNRYAFSVTYTDNFAINAATIGNGNIIVAGPRGINYLGIARWIGPAGGLANAPSVTAAYSIVPPNGAWDAADNGVYTVILQYKRIADVAGNRIGLKKTGTPLGTFRVNIPRASRTVRTAVKPAITIAAAMIQSPQPSLFASGGKRIGADVWD